LCSVRLLAIGKVAAVHSFQLSNGLADTSYAIRRFAEDSVCVRSNLPASSSTLNGSSDAERNNNNEGVPYRSKSRPESLPALATQPRVMSEGRSLQDYLAQIYQGIAENRVEIQQLKAAIELGKPEDERKNPALHSNTNALMRGGSSILDHETIRDGDSSTNDKFFDCRSTISTLKGDHAISSGSPNGYFESTSSFYPEQYSTGGLFHDPIFVFAIMQSEEDYRTQKHFLMYAETPRRWRRIIVSTTFTAVQDRSAIPRILAPDNYEGSPKVLPPGLGSQLSSLLPRLELFNSVTSLSLSTVEDGKRQMIIDSRRIAILEDHKEIDMSNEDEVLESIEDLGCPQFLESEVIVKSRISSTYYMAWVECRPCIERKAPFVKAGTQSENGYRDFFGDLKKINSLRGCAGVAEFIGVVLDDTRAHLRSYLYEYPAFGNLQTIFEYAQSKSEIVPWPLRENWGRQIIRAVSEVHRRGFVIGGTFLPFTIGVRADGMAILTDFRASQRHMPNNRGLLAPELRTASHVHCKPPVKVMTSRTDVFQLGRILWLLIEHKANIFGYLCALSGCTSHPRYMCTADHTNPVDLPARRAGIPTYFTDIIKACRSLNPRDRPTAHQLAKRAIEQIRRTAIIFSVLP
ncbi:MAG: hypothetical protein Q9164_006199, partial [Protoblastenia rupestris]